MGTKRAAGFEHHSYKVNAVWHDDGHWRTTVYAADWTPIGDAIDSDMLSVGTRQARERIERIITADALGMDTESAALHDEVMGW